MRGRPSRAILFRIIISICTLSPIVAAKEPVSATHGMVVAQEPIAADVGLQVLKGGGNAVDAAVAVGFALAVTYPYAGNIGGGGFMLIRMSDGKTAFLDFRESAPSKANHDMYIGPDGTATRESIQGWKSSGVPGSIAGFDLALKSFGTKSWTGMLAPAVKLAKDGFVIDDVFTKSLTTEVSKALGSDPESRRMFYPNGEALKAGETLKQPNLAATLERVAKSGAKEFYSGETAKQFAKAEEEHGGLITLDDLRGYRVVERKPLEGDYKGFHIITSPPPSAGGIGLLQICGMLAPTKYVEYGPDSAMAVHYQAEAMRRFYADRGEYIGDPEFFNVPTSALLDPAYLAKRRQTIDDKHATPSEFVEPGLPKTLSASIEWRESSETTHYNVVDSKGNAVAVTYTLNGGFGNGIMVPGLGFLLNNEMDDFVAKPGSPNMFGMVGGEANAIAPGKRPVSSMTPAIVTQNGKLFMVVGAPGGSRITTGVTEVLLNVLDFHMNPQDAVDLPRFHQQWKPDVLFMETGFDQHVEQQLRIMGYEIRPIEGVARVEAIVVKDGVLQGGTESRRHGKVSGY